VNPVRNLTKKGEEKGVPGSLYFDCKNIAGNKKNCSRTAKNWSQTAIFLQANSNFFAAAKKLQSDSKKIAARQSFESR
jgi:hypothetical protein